MAEIEFICTIGHVTKKPLDEFEDVDMIWCPTCPDIDFNFNAINMLQFDPDLPAPQGKMKRRAPMDIELKKQEILSHV